MKKLILVALTAIIFTSCEKEISIETIQPKGCNCDCSVSQYYETRVNFSDDTPIGNELHVYVNGVLKTYTINAGVANFNTNIQVGDSVTFKGNMPMLTGGMVGLYGVYPTGAIDTLIENAHSTNQGFSYSFKSNGIYKNYIIYSGDPQ